MTSQPGKQTIAMHIMPNISKSKDNKTVKFGQLIEYNMRKIFLEQSYPKCGGETSPKPFSKKLDISRSINILKLSCTPLAFTSYVAFAKQKEVWN